MTVKESGSDKLHYTRDELWAIYTYIGVCERHFNSIQEKYRVLTSTWLLATVAAVAYIFVNKDHLPISPSVIASTIAFIGSIGVTLLWLLDVKVYQTFLSSFYEEGLILEQTQNWLPSIRKRIRNRFKGKVPVLISIYYLGSMIFLFFVGMCALIISLESGWRSEAAIPLVLAIFCSCAMVLVLIFSRQSRAILSQEYEEERLNAYRDAQVSE